MADLQRGQSLAELRKEYPKIFAQYDIETIKLADILKLKQQIAEEEAKRAGEKRAKEFSDIESEIKYYENLLKSLSGQQGVDGYVKKLKELRAERDVMLQEKGKVSLNSSFPILKMLILVSLTATSLSWRSVSEERGKWNCETSFAY